MDNEAIEQFTNRIEILENEIIKLESLNLHYLNEIHTINKELADMRRKQAKKYVAEAIVKIINRRDKI